jgi:Mg-chelatase subunit ChlD
MNQYTKNKHVKNKNQEPVEILVIADRSGSMSSIKSDAIGGFNTFLEEQQKLDGDANLTLVLFDDRYEIPVDSTPIEDVLPLTEETFVPRGMTAMNDAIGKALNTLISKNPKNTIVCVITDGMENASREYTAKSVRELIDDCSKERNWEFVYLAANQDAFAEGSIRGFVNNINYTADSKGINDAYTSMSLSASTYRNSVNNNDDNKQSNQTGG